MGEVFRVFATLGIDATEFDKGLAGAEQRLKGVEQAFGGAGRTLTAGVTAPLVGIGAGALTVAADFEQSMNQVRAVSGATGEEFVALRELAKELGATTQFSASQAADAMNFLAMAGMDTQSILGAMPDTLKLAAAAQLDMGSAADIVTNIMAGFGMETDQLGGAVDVLVQAFTNANTDLPQLAEAMKYAGPVANAAGIDFESAAAAMALMGNAGIQGSMAGTSLRGAITRLLNPTSKAAEIMNELGLSFKDAEGQLVPLDEMLLQLEPHADNAGLFMELFGERAGPAMAALVTQGSGALVDLTQKLHESGGRAAEVADVQMEGLTGAMRLFKSAGEAALIAIADSGLLEAATEFLTVMAGWIQNLSEVNPIILRGATILGGLLAALGPVLWAVGSFAGAVSNLLPILRMVPGAFTAVRTAIGLLSGPIGWVVTAITLIATAWATDFMGFRTFIKEAWGWVVDAFRDVRDKLRSALNAIRENFLDWWDNVTSFFQGIPEKMLGFGKDIISGLMDGVKSMMTGAVDAVKGVGEGIISGFKNLLGIASPSKVFFEFGQDIGQGLADGIEDSQGVAVAAVERLGGALAAAGRAVVSGALSAENIVGGIVGNLTGRDAIAAIEERLAVNQDTWRRLPGVSNMHGARSYMEGLNRMEFDALTAELRRLREEVALSRRETARTSEATTRRFSLAVDSFGQDVRNLTLAKQRY